MVGIAKNSAESSSRVATVYLPPLFMGNRASANTQAPSITRRYDGRTRQRIPLHEDAAPAPLEARLSIQRRQQVRDHHLTPREYRCMGDTRFIYFTYRGRLDDAVKLQLTLMPGRPPASSPAKNDVNDDNETDVAPIVRAFVIHRAEHAVKRFTGGKQQHEYILPSAWVPPLTAPATETSVPQPSPFDSVLRVRCALTKMETSASSGAFLVSGVARSANHLRSATSRTWDIVWECNNMLP